MKVNFEIEENYAVQFQKRHIDLHNNFELVEIRNLQDQIEIKFKRSNRDWVAKDELDKLLFACKNISYKHEEDGKNDSFPEDWKVLSELTYFPSDMREINDGMIPQRFPKENDDIIFFFENGRFFRIKCEEIELIIR